MIKNKTLALLVALYGANLINVSTNNEESSELAEAVQEAQQLASEENYSQDEAMMASKSLNFSEEDAVISEEESLIEEEPSKSISKSWTFKKEEVKSLAGIMEAMQAGFNCVYQCVMQVVQNAQASAHDANNEISPVAEMAGDAAESIVVSSLSELVPPSIANSTGEEIAADVTAIVDYLADHLNAYLASESSQLASSMNYSIVQDDKTVTITFPSASHHTDPKNIAVNENIASNTIEISNMISINDEIKMMVCYSFAKPSNVNIDYSSAEISMDSDNVISIVMNIIPSEEQTAVSEETQADPSSAKSNKRSHEVSSTVYSVNILRRS